jgi:hypothetical protein
MKKADANSSRVGPLATSSMIAIDLNVILYAAAVDEL